MSVIAGALPACRGGDAQPADAGVDEGMVADSGCVDGGTDAGVDGGTDAGVDGGTDAGVDSGTDAAVDTRTVFVSSVVYDGNLGGLGGADAKCQLLAANAGLTGTFRAWLATTTSSPSVSFTQHDGPYVLVDGTQIAANWTDLTDGALSALINKTETGGAPPTSTATGCAPNSVWTATGQDGSFAPRSSGWHCGDWTTTAGDGTVGDWTFSDGLWTNRCGGGNSCAQTAALYCFQQ